MRLPDASLSHHNQKRLDGGLAGLAIAVDVTFPQVTGLRSARTKGFEPLTF